MSLKDTIQELVETSSFSKVEREVKKLRDSLPIHHPKFGFCLAVAFVVGAITAIILFCGSPV